MANTTQAANAISDALVAIIREEVASAGASGLPSGHLYAAFSGFMGLPAYQSLLRYAEACGAICFVGDMLHSPVDYNAGESYSPPTPPSWHPLSDCTCGLWAERENLGVVEHANSCPRAR